MNDPYKVLGVPQNATEAQIKEAYRELAKKYHPDKYVNNPLADLAAEKMREINEAYDTLTKNKGTGSQYTGGANNSNYGGYGNTGKYGNYGGFGGYGNYSGYGSQNSNGANSAEYVKVRSLINQNMLDEAERLLSNISVRNAQWHYLMGLICQKRGWYDKAYQQFARAVNLEPYNMEYRSAYNAMNNAQGAYTQNSAGYGYNTPSAMCCDTCQTLMCLNCLCDMCGGGGC